MLIRPDIARTEEKDPETVAVDDDERPWRRGIAPTYRHKSVLAVLVDIQTAELDGGPTSVGREGHHKTITESVDAPAGSNKRVIPRGGCS